MHSVGLPDFVNRWPTPTPWQQQESIESWTERRARVRGERRNGNGFGTPLDMAARMWPTPTSTERPGTNPNTGKGEGLSKTAKMWPTPRGEGTRVIENPETARARMDRLKAEGQQTGGIRNLAAEARMFPTPRAGKTTDEDEESWLARHAAGKVATPPLDMAARMWPTPNAHEDRAEKYTLETPERHLREGRQIHLAQVVRMLPTPSSGGESGGPHGICGGMWPTPTSRDHKDGDAHSCQNVPVNGLLGREVHMLPTPSSAYAVGSSGGSRGADLRNAAGGSLSPDWVEWLMGVPIGWTSMEPLAQADYAQWLQAQQDGTWWLEERGLPRIATGIPDRVNRLRCLGNGIVPASLAVFLRC